jgi:hypothetical protein
VIERTEANMVNYFTQRAKLFSTASATTSYPLGVLIWGFGRYSNRLASLLTICVWDFDEYNLVSGHVYVCI